MHKRGMWRYGTLLLMAVVIAGCGTGTVFAVSSNSSNYQVTETQFGAGSTLESCSAQYCAKASIGDMASGRSKSSGGETQATFGKIIDGEPLLEVIVQPGESNLGVLTTETTATKTTSVQVRNYLSGGYTLQIVGDPPKFEGHSLKTSSTAQSSKPGTEQFGINAAANTSPQVGAVPVQVPSAQTSFGTVINGYDTPNMFKYDSGAVLARSTTESGRTDYTISMIVNVSNTTPAGHYNGDFSAIVIPVY